MIVEVVFEGKQDKKKDERKKRNEQKHRRRRQRAPNLLGLSLGGGTKAKTARGQAGLPDEEATAAEDDDADDDSGGWRVYLLF
jgi:hypothetical protein